MDLSHCFYNIYVGAKRTSATHRRTREILAKDSGGTAESWCCPDMPSKDVFVRGCMPRK